MTSAETEHANPHEPERYANNPARLAEALEKGGFENLGDEKRLDIVEHATPEDFQQAVIGIHKLLAPEADPNPTERQMKLIGKNGEVLHVAASPEQRDEILKWALRNAQAVVAKYRSEGGQIKDALNRCGNLLAFGVVMSHMFDDGSGRTARVLGHLVREPFAKDDPKSKDALNALGNNRPSTGFRINSYVPLVNWANQDPGRFLDTVAALDTPLDDSSYKAIAANQFMTPYGS